MTIKNELKSIKYICTTADVWSSSKRSYMGITAHWINEDLTRGSTALACRRFKGSHIYDKLASMISDIHDEFIDKNTTIIKTVTDNGANMVKAFKESRNEVEESASSENLFLQELLRNDSLKHILEVGYEADATHTKETNRDNTDNQDDDILTVPISDVLESINPRSVYTTVTSSAENPVIGQHRVMSVSDF